MMLSDLRLIRLPHRLAFSISLELSLRCLGLSRGLFIFIFILPHYKYFFIYFLFLPWKLGPMIEHLPSPAAIM